VNDGYPRMGDSKGFPRESLMAQAIGWWISHRWLSPPAVLVSALRAWNKLRGPALYATTRVFTHHTSPGGAAPPLPGPTGPGEEEG
ncbi:MAG: hypothetical protein ACK57Y_02720, partial [Pirellulaceae bacterium]